MAKFDKGEFTLVPSKTARSGMNPTLQCVYMWLCDHSNEKMQSYPSRKVLAAECGISVDTLDKALTRLEEYGMVTKESQYKNNEQTTNLYTVNIIDTPPQKQEGVAVKTTLGGRKSPTQNSTHITQSNKLTISNDIGASSLMKPEKKEYGNPEVNKLIETFSSLTGLRLMKMTEQRRYGSLLIKANGIDNCLAACAVVGATMEDQYAPRISDIKELYYKFGQLQVYARKKQGESKKGQVKDLSEL